MKKSFFPLFLLFIFSVHVFSQAWDGVTVKAPALNGTEYTINTPAELAWIAAQKQTFAGYSFVMTQSLDLGGQDQVTWTPIGSEAIPFEGDFNGNCFTISNMTLNGISGRMTDYGLFGVIGENGRVHDLAIESGNIFFDFKRYVGAFAGRNNGTIDHCFSLIRIFVDQTDIVGGIAGENRGTIDHCFQGGYIEFARDNVGGLVGHNVGVVSNSYVSGFTYAVGAGGVVGINEGTFTNVYLDQQMGPMQPGKDGLVEGIVVAAFTTDMYDIFKNDPDWLTDSDLYPQLACFAEKSPDASIVAVSPVIMPTQNNGSTQRAESVTKSFSLCVLNDVEWFNGGEMTSLGEEIVKINGGSAVVSRPCSLTDVRLTVTKNGHSRTVLIKVKGYDRFTPGIIGNRAKACRGDIFKFSHKEKGGEVRNASGGRDDNTRLFPYHYKFEKYVLQDLDGDGILEDTTLIGTQFVTSVDYKDFMIFADENGHFMYKRYVHDSMCQLEYVESGGAYYLTVFDSFDAGEIDSEVEVLFGVPRELHIQNVREAKGGEGPYDYNWHLTQKSVNYVTGTETIVKDSVQLPWPDEFNHTDPEYTLEITQPGEYYFYRGSLDKFCSTQSYTQSEGVKLFIVYDEFKPGVISNKENGYCTTAVSGSIGSVEDARGGDGRIEYRWLCDGNVIEGATTAELKLSTMTFEYGRTYQFQRQAKEGSGFTDWTFSDNTFTVTIYEEVMAGKIASPQSKVCLAADAQTFMVDINNVAAASGEGDLKYRWNAYERLNGSDTKIRDIDENTSDLHHEFDVSDITFPTTIVFKRQVKSQLCTGGWKTAEGEAIITLGKDVNEQQDVYVCGGELPYDYTYRYSDGRTGVVTFTATDEQKTVNDSQADGCALNVTLTCKHYPAPKVDVQPLGNICEDDTKLTINYQIADGSPNAYRLTFNDAALSAGFQNESAELTGDPIVVDIPETAGYGEYEVTAEFFETESQVGCAPYVVSLHFNISLQGFVYQKWGDVLFVDNNPNNHEQGDDDKRFVSFQWFKNGELIPGATGQMYYDPYLQNDLNAVYTVQLVGNDGTSYYTCDFRPSSFTGLNDAAGFALYPVPVSVGQSFSLDTPVVGTASVLDVTGRLVNSFKLNGSQHYIIAAPNTAGTYLVRVDAANGQRAFQKLVVK